MAREIRNKNTEVLVGELLRVESHDFFVGGQAMKKNDGSGWSAGARFINIGSHTATAGGGENGFDFVGFAMREEIAEAAEEQTCQGLQQLADIHRTRGRSEDAREGRHGKEMAPRGA